MRKFPLILFVPLTLLIAACDKRSDPPPTSYQKANPPPGDPYSRGGTPNGVPVTAGPTGASGGGGAPSGSVTYSQAMLKMQLNWLESLKSPPSDRISGGGYAAYWCAEGVDCRSRAVMVHIDNIGTCTGVLIAEDIVMTNRHCVDKVATEPFTSVSSIVVSVPKAKKDDAGGVLARSRMR